MRNRAQGEPDAGRLVAANGRGKASVSVLRCSGLLWLFLLVPVGCGVRGDEQGADASLPLARSPFHDAVSSVSSSRTETDLPQHVLSCARFRDVHEEAGIEHVYANGEAGRCLLMETTGGGAGWLDFDADGHWDLYLNQGGDPTVDPDETQPHDALFRNLGDGTFQDVTRAARVVEFRYSQGVAVGDYDDDGFDDVYVTNMGRNTLFHNQGDGTFLDVTEEAGVGDERWSASAAWADLDLDGDLDLYVANYCVYDRHNPRVCANEKGEPRICHPGEVPPGPTSATSTEVTGRFPPRRPNGASSAATVVGWEWPWPTSTTTDGRTFSSRTTSRRTSCS